MSLCEMYKIDRKLSGGDILIIKKISNQILVGTKCIHTYNLNLDLEANL